MTTLTQAREEYAVAVAIKEAFERITAMPGRFSLRIAMYSPATGKVVFDNVKARREFNEQSEDDGPTLANLKED